MELNEKAFSLKEFRSLLGDIPESTEIFVKVPQGMLASRFRPSSFVFPIGGTILLKPHETENRKYVLFLLPSIDQWET